MKKVTFLLAALLVGGMMLTGCKKDDQNNNGNNGNNGETPATEVVYSVKYELLETAQVQTGTFSVLPGCTFDVSYVNAEGNTVEVKNVTAPWSVTVDNIKKPFTAKLEGTVNYDEAQLPETDINFVKFPQITITPSVGQPEVSNDFFCSYFSTKQKFLDAIQQNSRILNFLTSKEL